MTEKTKVHIGILPINLSTQNIIQEYSSNSYIITDNNELFIPFLEKPRHLNKITFLEGHLKSTINKPSSKGLYNISTTHNGTGLKPFEIYQFYKQAKKEDLFNQHKSQFKDSYQISGIIELILNEEENPLLLEKFERTIEFDSNESSKKSLLQRLKMYK